MKNVLKLGNITHPVSDVSAAVAFYREGLGMDVKFTDGDDYAALSVNGGTLALAGLGEDPVGAVSASFKVSDVSEAIATVTRAGGTLVSGPARGAHEIRAVIEDPWRNKFVLYSSLPDSVE